MQSDRELLEKAAKAYWGDEIDDVCSIRWLEEDRCIGYTHGDNQDHNGIDREFVWDPLEDDDDAFRLAVKLGIGTRHHVQWSEVFSPVTGVEYFNHDGDSLSATRRAIVRAAAAMANGGNE